MPDATALATPNGQQILEAMRAFQPVCIIGAAAELDVWGAIGEQSLSADEAAQKLGGNVRAATMLLDAVAALNLLVKEQGRYRVPAELRPLLTHGTPQTVLPMVLHSMNILRNWSQLAWVTKAGIPGPNTASIRGFEADRRGLHRRHAQRLDAVGRRARGQAGTAEIPPSAGRGRGLGHLDTGVLTGRARRESHDLRPARCHRTSPTTAGKIGIRRPRVAGKRRFLCGRVALRCRFRLGERHLPPARAAGQPQAFRQGISWRWRPAVRSPSATS